MAPLPLRFQYTTRGQMIDGLDAPTGLGFEHHDQELEDYLAGLAQQVADIPGDIPIRYAATLTALTALTGVPHGSIGVIGDTSGTVAGGDPPRIYVYDSSAGWQYMTHWAPAGRTVGQWRRAAAQSIANNTLTAISWDTEDVDSEGQLTPTSSTWTAQQAGLYQFTAYVTYLPTTLLNANIIRFASSTGLTFDFAGATTASGIQSGSVMIACAVGTTMTVSTYHTNGAAVNATGYLLTYRVGA